MVAEVSYTSLGHEYKGKSYAMWSKDKYFQLLNPLPTTRCRGLIIIL